MKQYHIEGGHPLKGRIRASGNKNAALPCIAAALLSEEPVTLRNIPEIEDVLVMLDICRALGATVERLEPDAWKIDGSTIRVADVPAPLAAKVRASILFAGPLLARFGKVTLPPPGGDVIGRRRLDTHFLALEELGARIEVDGAFLFTANKLKGADIFLDEASVTATENAVMAAALAEGRTVIRNAASEPHVQDVCKLVQAMGGLVSGIGSNILTIDGVQSLHGADFAIGPDFMEVGSFIGLAAVTRGDIVIEGVVPDDLRMMKIAFNRLGIGWSIDGSDLSVHSGQTLRVVPDLGGQIPKIDDAPWPGFPPDLTSIMTVVATQAEGTVLIHEKMFESRMFWVDKLIGMGARIVLCDPHRAVVSGPSRLRGDSLTSPDVRAGMALVIAALCAEGTSVIKNVYQIERGYEHITERLQKLGARIQRQDE
ncbi:MAG: UDP-N-acetylglucosamine 1-carboxyvinyltransferase [Spirochaetia bacterium]|jgi:UDP-N-acetylglucosamine 1-carboxyvinyltransferase|nr:UDP-N-acetylglucosamine 1-carboxyvinyltransferase [Spirochaetia bacterium]